MIWLVGSGRWTPPLPINAYVIEHADGPRPLRHGAGPRLGHGPRLLPGRRDRLSLRAPCPLPDRGAGHPGREAGSARTQRLRRPARDPVPSPPGPHRGIRYLPNAEFIVADGEWRAMEQPRSAMNGYLRGTSTCPASATGGSASRRPTTRRSPRSRRPMTFWATARSSCCPFPGTHRARPRCSSGGRASPHCSWSAT